MFYILHLICQKFSFSAPAPKKSRVAALADRTPPEKRNSGGLVVPPTPPVVTVQQVLSVAEKSPVSTPRLHRWNIHSPVCMYSICMSDLPTYPHMFHSDYQCALSRPGMRAVSYNTETCEKCPRKHWKHGCSAHQSSLYG